MARLLRISPVMLDRWLLMVAAIALASGLAGGRADAAASGAVPAASGALRSQPDEVARLQRDQQRARAHSLQFFRQRLRRLHLGIQAGVGAGQRRGQGDAERSALDLLGRRRRQELSLQDRHPDERHRLQPGRRRRRADRRSCHGQIEAAGGQDLYARRRHGVSDRADPAHHRGGARGKIGARADGL